MSSCGQPQGVTSSLGAGLSKIRRRKRKGCYGMFLRHSDLVESCELCDEISVCIKAKRCMDWQSDMFSKRTFLRN